MVQRCGPDASAFNCSVLAKFSPEVAVNAAHLLVKEIVGRVDKPEGTTGFLAETEQELEWIMQVLDHALNLDFLNARDLETVQNAVRVYIAWLSAVKANPHPTCPAPIIKHPDKYFHRLLHALLAVLEPRAPPSANNNGVHGRPAGAVHVQRQCAEIRKVLTALRHLYRQCQLREGSRAELWTRTLLFMKSACNVLLAKVSWPEELPSVMAPDLAESLFDCWTLASITDQIPTKSYWKTLANDAETWITHVPVIEWWGRKVLPLTVIMANRLYGPNYCTIPIRKSKPCVMTTIPDDHHLVNVCSTLPNTSEDKQTLQETWLQLLTLFGNPASILDRAEKFCLQQGADLQLSEHIQEQAALAFYMSMQVFAKVIDIFLGDSNMSIDLNENEELSAQWTDYQRQVYEDWNKSHRGSFHRASNLSTTSSTQSGVFAHLPGLSAEPDAPTANGTAAATSAAGDRPKRSYTANPARIAAKLSAKSIHAVSLQTDAVPEPPSALDQPDKENLHPVVPLKSSQFVWHSLKSHKCHALDLRNENRAPSSALLDLFIGWLQDCAQIPVKNRQKHYSEDVISQRSLNSVDTDTQQMNADGPVARRSFAASTASSSDLASAAHPLAVSSVSAATSAAPFDPAQLPHVDGVAAGKSAALSALCRVVCAKLSSEALPDHQLAQFLTVIHDALLERDRLMLCAILFHSTELFKLGLKGVELLLPNYVTAVDIILTESFKLRLHPSINEVDMRHSCLRALASVLVWPTTFGAAPLGSGTDKSRLYQGPNNALQPATTYEELRAKIIRSLVYTLRNETDSLNLQLALGLCLTFCQENAVYDREQLTKSARAKEEDPAPSFSISALKQIVSAICDNLSKPQWSAELGTSLAAFDCLNALSTFPSTVLFHNGEHSTGALIVSSLCRFVNIQLNKAPPLHSRDLHSSVVAAFQSLEVWLCAAPILAEMESCLATVAETIEFGMTGGQGLAREDYKPASMRVRDAAESLQFVLFGSVGAQDHSSVVDEHSVIRKLGDDNLSLDQFQHFVVDNFSILSVHNLTHVDFVSHGQPAVVLVSRTPFRAAHATLIHLKARVDADEEADPKREGSEVVRRQSIQPIEATVTSTPPKPPRHRFEIPPEVFEPECRLDEELIPRGPTEESLQIETKLRQFQEGLARGAVSPFTNRDQRNVWINSDKASELCKAPEPTPPFKSCNAVRVFLYAMGLIDRRTFGQDFISLDPKDVSDFYKSMHSIVDRQPAKKCETVYIFYVRRGQQDYEDILRNTENIENTDPEFVRLVSRLGRARRVQEPGFWSGHWSTAFAPPPSLDSDPFARGPETETSLRSLDGIENCIWWSDAQLEVAYQLPSLRSTQRNAQWLSGLDHKVEEPSSPNKALNLKPPVRRYSCSPLTHPLGSFADAEGGTRCLRPDRSPSAPKSPRSPQLQQQSSLNYIRSFFRRRPTEPAPLAPIPEPAPPLKTLTEVTEEELDRLFPRMPSPNSAKDRRNSTLDEADEDGLSAQEEEAELNHSPADNEMLKSDKGCTPSSTASSLTPHSREGSSLTDDSGAVLGKRSSDMSAPTSACRTRSASTVNSDSGHKPPPTPANQGQQRRTSSSVMPKRSPDQRVIVVWLEHIEDMHSFPYDQLLLATDDGSRRVHTQLKSHRADLHILFLQNFEPGLVRVHCEAVWTKAGQPGPLVDGTVVSTGALPALLRQTVANIARRKAVEVDLPTPAHSRRHAIQELAKKYACGYGYTEFLDRFILDK